jgi:serine/threonine-protein kinase RsbW
VNHARQLGASPVAADAVALAVSEAVTNAVVHAYAGEAPGPVIVEADADGEGHFIVVISDEGTGMLPEAASPGLGLGIPLMARMADRVEVTTGDGSAGTRVSLCFSLDGSGVSLCGDQAVA